MNKRPNFSQNDDCNNNYNMIVIIIMTPMSSKQQQEVKPLYNSNAEMANDENQKPHSDNDKINPCCCL